MQIQEQVSLKTYNTFGIDVLASKFASVTSIEELKSILELSKSENKLILGGGSNMLLTKNVEAFVIHLNIKGIHIIEETNNHVIIKAYAGENWHELVLWCIAHNFGGIENLSLIPGNVGATPIQNIGAYGVEIKDVMVCCQALHIASGQIKTFNNKDCNFNYRESIFKQELKDQYIVLSVNLQLTKNNHHLKAGYGAISAELAASNIINPSIKDISNAVIAIRESKLPNPKEIGNSGSFFKNPIISKDKYETLLENFSDVPHYPISETAVKIPAGWLIEHAGFKGKTLGNYGVHKKQALVLVNYGGAKGEELFNLAKLIQLTVKRLFEIEIEMEVNII